MAARSRPQHILMTGDETTSRKLGVQAPGVCHAWSFAPDWEAISRGEAHICKSCLRRANAYWRNGCLYGLGDMPDYVRELLEERAHRTA